MLPGVEVARRRRVRAGQMRNLDAYDGVGGGSGGGLGRTDTHRSRMAMAVTVSSHHHHHHHRHHVHPRHSNPSSRPGTPRPGSLVRRMQDVLQELQEHRHHSSLSPSSSSSNRVLVVESTTSSHGHSHNHNPSSSNSSSSSNSGSGSTSSSSSRVFGRSASEFRDGHFASRWRRHATGTFSDLRGAALEARNRLDERLRLAAHASSNRFPEAVRIRRNVAAVPYSLDLNVYNSDDEDESLWSDDDGWETSLHEWLASWAPSVQESWQPWPRVDSSSSNRSHEAWPSWPRVDVPPSSSSRSTPSSNSRSYKSKASEGLSEAAINALPRGVVGQNGNTGKLEQEDCPVCLEGVLPGQLVITLPCEHRFHPECLTPWLSNHGQCPYCRAEIVKDTASPEVQNRSAVHDDEDHLSWVEVIERGIDRLNYL